MRAKLLLALASLTSALLLGELALRALGYYGVRGAHLEKLELVDDPIVDYRRIPNLSWVRDGKLYEINSHGWRDREHTLAKPPGSYRILSLGDSVTNGYGVNVEEIYTKQLEARLNRDGDRTYEVVLITQGALNTEQEVHLAEVEGLRYEPDLIIIGYVLNDPAEGASLRRDREQARRRTALEAIKEEAKRSSLAHLLYRAGQRALWKARRWRGSSDVAAYATDDTFGRLHGDPVAWRRVTDAFARLSRVSVEAEVPVLIVIFPILHQLESYPWASIHGQVAGAARERGFHVLDLLASFRGHDPEDLQVSEGDHVHPNVVGHRLAAEAIEDYLRTHMLEAAP